MDFNLNHELERLKSSEPGEQIPAVDALAEIVSSITQQAVNALEGPHQYLVAERLHRFGTLAIPPLEKLLKDTETYETRILVSLVLFKLGSKVGLPHLLDAILNSSNYYCLAARQLAEARILETADNAITRLRSSSLDEIDLIFCLLECLKILERPIPLDIRDRLSALDAPRLLKLGLHKFFNITPMSDDTA
ncbi:MAG: hypothetical protein ABI947_16480 [Chloroflexota bacterium]